MLVRADRRQRGIGSTGVPFADESGQLPVPSSSLAALAPGSIRSNGASVRWVRASAARLPTGHRQADDGRCDGRSASRYAVCVPRRARDRDSGAI